MNASETRIVAVDQNDHKIRLIDKIQAHLNNGILHRAIMIFVFNSDGDLLLQKRSDRKMLWPSFWDSTCATHPFNQESYEKCGQRRLQEELGFTTQLKYLGKFFYQAKYKNVGAEKEICAVLVGFYDGEINPNKKEVAETKWIDFEKLLIEIKQRPDKFTPWLKIGLEKFVQEIKQERLKIVFKHLSNLVEPKIKEVLSQDISRRTSRLLFYPVSIGGKRLRPALAIISCLATGGKMKDVIYPAASLEILHNYTLIVDDTIDHGLIRRGKPTLQKEYGLSMAECLAVDYVASIFQPIAQYIKPEIIIPLFTRTLKTIFEGEILDILFEQTGRNNEPYIQSHRYSEISLKQYLKMVSQKTASLIQASCHIGGICAKTSGKQLAALQKYGFSLGIAFQIQDDILDIFGYEKKFGKKIGKDIEERKMGNIVILLASQEFSRKEKNKFQSILRKNKITNQDIKEAIHLIKQTSAQEKAQNLARKYVRQSKKSLAFLSQNKWTSLLADLADFVIEREK